MQTADREVLEQVADWLGEERRVWLCTVIRTVGSSPRPVGSIVAICEGGRRIGSVSGGCVEDDLLERLAQGRYSGVSPELIEYGVSAAENERFGLPCGGRIVLLLQCLVAADRVWIGDILKYLQARQCVKREVDLANGATSLSPLNRFEPLVVEQDKIEQSFGPQMRLLLVGAGQLASSLAELALAMDYEVMVTDPRRDLLDQWTGPEVKLLPGMPDDVALEYACDASSIVITLTHDPRIDDMALMEALKSDAWYVGALGSQRTTQQRRQRLRDLDLSAEDIERLHAPVGLDIGSKTPIEIAVAIMAEITALRRGRLPS